jgi:glycosyltransferase involved in cell wall biosynthesis
MFPASTVVTIPVKDEETLLPHCLAALAAQSRQPDHVILLLNNCTDNSLNIARAAQTNFKKLHLAEVHLPPGRASAGEARRLAFLHAEQLAGDGVILTTDADATPRPDWVARNLLEISKGADAVCGTAIIAEAPPAPGWHSCAFDGMREALLVQLHDEMAALVDPDPADPWPRHQAHSGASIAVRAAALRQAGGPPSVPAGEDRALIAKLRLVDARIRHAPEIAVPVSARLHGRAAGGMAETNARRATARDDLVDDQIEPTVDAYRRVLTQARLRAARGDEDALEDLARDLLIQPASLYEAMTEKFFGAAWANVQSLSPVLRRRRVPFSQLARETRQALVLTAQLRGAAAADAPPYQLAEPAFSARHAR